MSLPPCLLLVLCLPVFGQAEEPLPQDAVPAAQEAYRLQLGGDLQGAARAAERALLKAPGNYQLGRLKLDLLLGTGELAEADRLSLALLEQRPGDGPLRLQRIYLLCQLNRPGEALQAAHGLLQDGSLPVSLQRSARLAVTDVLQNQGQLDQALDTLAAFGADPAPEVQSRKAFLLLAQGRALEARTAFALALKAPEDAAQERTLLLGDRDAARQAGLRAEEARDLERLLALAPADRGLALELAYARLGVRDDRGALAAFRSALGPGSAPAAFMDGAYTAKRLGRNREAALWFAQGLEAQRRLPGYQGETEPEFGLRREVEALSRTWGVSAGTYYRQGGVLPGVVSTEKVLQQGLDLFWQPEALASNGRNLQLYTEAFENLWDANGGTTGGPTVQVAAGARVKPLASQDLVFGLEKLFRGGRLALDDWMFRLGYSADRGVDLKTWQQRWQFWSVFTEADSLARTGRYLQTLEAKWGESFRLPARSATAWTPHLVLAGDFDNRNAQETATAVGCGLQVRSWFRQGTDRAPASWLEGSIQVRARLTSSPRQGGLFIRASLWF